MPRGVPRVSVAIPVYNAARYLREAMQSVLGQTLRGFEAVVVDDGSTDGSGDLIDAMAAADDRVRVIHQPNRGLVPALNAAVDACRGDLIARFDGDDVCEPTRFEKQAAFLDDHPEVVAVGSWMQGIDPEGGELNVFEYPADHDAIERGFLDARNCLGHPAAMIRADALRRVGPYRHENYTTDLDLFLRLAEDGRLANLPEPLIRYRQHPASVCATRRPEQVALVRRVIDDARRRRGLPPIDALPGDPASTETPGGRHRRFLLHAVRRGEMAAARRHAWRMLRAEPTRLRNWRAARWAWTG